MLGVSATQKPRHPLRRRANLRPRPPVSGVNQRAGRVRGERSLGKLSVTRLIHTEQEDEKHNLFLGLGEVLPRFISWSSW